MQKQILKEIMISDLWSIALVRAPKVDKKTGEQIGVSVYWTWCQYHQPINFIGDFTCQKMSANDVIREIELNGGLK